VKPELAEDTDLSKDPNGFEIHDDYVYFPRVNKKIPRPDGVPPKQFRILWEFAAKRIKALGTLEERNKVAERAATNSMRMFRRMADPDYVPEDGE
jgi:hypothetical protein